MVSRFSLAFLALTFAAVTAAAAAASLQPVASISGRGLVDATIVAHTPAGERIFQTFEYSAGLELVEIDPANGESQVFHSNLRETGGSLAFGSDGKVYVGTHPGGHVLRLDPATSKFADLGRLDTEQYVWALEPASDGSLYAGTYPGAKLFRIDEASGAISSLGHVGPPEDEYARSLALSADQKTLYVGVGSVHADVIAIDLQSRSHRSLAPDAGAGVAEFFHTSDGLYATVGSHTLVVRPDGAAPAPVKPSPAPIRLASGERLQLTNDGIILKGDTSSRAIPLTYRGGPLEIFRMNLGPDGKLYVSTIQPAYLERLDPSGGGVTNLGYIGGGEVYSSVSYRSLMFMSMYYGPAQSPIIAFDTSRGYSAAAPANPKIIHYSGEDPSWRPYASVGINGHIYVGSQPGYGSAGGHLVEIAGASATATDLGIPIAGQSITSLAAWRGKLVGATSDLAGVGATVSRADSKLFVYDPGAHAVAFATVPIPNAEKITDLAVRGDTVFGIADTEMFAYNLAAQKLMYSRRFEYGTPLSNCVAPGPDGAIWGASTAGIFRIDGATGELSLPAPATTPLSAGFALANGAAYVASGSTILMYPLGR